jgi:rhodanese-related sulfurtransferase/mono/diheme cytochrome c family protein
MAGYSKSIGGPLETGAIRSLVVWLRSHGSAAKPLPQVTLGDSKRGQDVYTKNCQKCHGDQQTRGEAVHLANARFLEVASDAFIRYAIVNGRPGTPMEAWQAKLSAQDIDDVVAFVRTYAKPADGKPVVAQRLPEPTNKEPLFVNPSGKPPSFKPRAEVCPTPPGDCKPEPRYVPADQVKQALEQGRKMVIIDARPPSEWMTVHITGAVSIPYHDMKRLEEIPKDAYVIAYCACPHHLSGIVVDELRHRGYPHAYVLDEGILEWQRRNYTVVAAPGVTAPPRELPVAPGTIQ